ncbi:hypothetical protein U9M48_018880 [Paspalum notatum var. saurae]|uniref:Uncharacterized protein n=1 Tax=Paspalum notatum var. saurae TaxID=547442 RepID=A0AAQ3WQW5_PASNO
MGWPLSAGVVFFALSAVVLRSKLARMIPRNIRLASAVGIGMFLAFTGLQTHQGVGLMAPAHRRWLVMKR